MTASSERTAPLWAARGIDTVVLLAGRVGANPLADGIGRPLVALPIGRGRTVLDAWQEQLARLAEEAGIPQIRVRIAVDRDSRAPEPGGASPRLAVEVVGDAAAYRGTAGVVKDVTRDVPPDGRILVAGANQVQVEPLSAVLADIGPDGEGVSLVPSRGGDVAGVFVLRRARLDSVPDVGFVDLKEQAIPASGGEPLRISRRPRGASHTVRTREEYLHALRALHTPAGAAADEADAEDDAFAEAWQPRFALIEPGADVAEGAVLQDAVVLSGGRVEAGAVVARSVVCPGATVRRGRFAVDAVVTREP